MARWVKAGLKSIGEDSVAAIERFGQSCHTGDLFPGVVHLVARYQDDLREAVGQAAMAGGDSATRGTVTALVLGAWLGRPAVPDEWVSGLTRLPHLEQLLGQLR
jgi:ADP-ribosylglycohydrolase